jgi:hypothetical protein
MLRGGVEVYNAVWLAELQEFSEKPQGTAVMPPQSRSLAANPLRSCRRREHLPDKCQHGRIKYVRSLQRREMTDTAQDSQFCTWNFLGQMPRMFLFNEFFVLALHDRDRNADLR